jgi:hypothetical protein
MGRGFWFNDWACGVSGEEAVPKPFRVVWRVKLPSSFGVSPLSELTPSAERRSLFLSFGPAATFEPTDLAKMVLASICV